jgi:hypothetical protein
MGLTETEEMTEVKEHDHMPLFGQGQGANIPIAQMNPICEPTSQDSVLTFVISQIIHPIAFASHKPSLKAGHSDANSVHSS